MSLPLSLRILVAACCLLGMAAVARADDRSSEARDLVHAMGCKGCHVIDKKGGTLGPDLDKVGRRLGKEQLRRQLVEPRVKNPASSMPSYGYLTEAQLDLLVEFLLTLR